MPVFRVLAGIVPEDGAPAGPVQNQYSAMPELPGLKESQMRSAYPAPSPDSQA
jgi:hypothetical protein